MDISTDDIESERAYALKRFEKISAGLENGEVVDESLYLAHGGLGDYSKELGVWSLIEGATAEAIEWFETAADHYTESIRERRVHREIIEKAAWGNEPYALADAMFSAILSGDGDLIEDAARTALDADETYTEEFPGTTAWYYFAVGLAGVLIDEPTERERGLSGLRAAHDSLAAKFKQFFAGRITVLESFAANDAARVEEGLQTMLDDHADDAPANTTSPDELICVPAMALLVLARRRGLDVDVESEYLPDTLPE
ncbi:Imm49 family immunity protein [Halobacteriaceae archaeon GCM10025711]